MNELKEDVKTEQPEAEAKEADNEGLHANDGADDGAEKRKEYQGSREEDGIQETEPSEVVEARAVSSETPNQERKKPRSQQRIEKLIEEKKQLEAQLQAYKDIKKPEAEAYDDDDEYEVDRTVYLQTKAEEKRNKAKLSQIENEAKAASRQAYEESSQGFYQKLNKLEPERLQFIQTNSSLHKPRDPEVEMEVMDSPYAAEIFEVMLQDVNKFNNLSDRQFIKEIGKIEARFENAKKIMKPPLSIPNPPTKLNQSNTGVKAESNNRPEWGKVSFAQAMKMR